MTVEDMKEVVWEFSSSRKNVLALLDKIYDTETEVIHKILNVLKYCFSPHMVERAGDSLYILK